MSEFSQCMSGSWSTSKQVFGATTVRINDEPVDVVEHRMDATDGVAQGRAGRTEDIQGELLIAREDWVRVGGRKGVAFRYGHLDVRVQNDPLASLHSDTLTLRIKAI